MKKYGKFVALAMAFALLLAMSACGAHPELKTKEDFIAASNKSAEEVKSYDMTGKIVLDTKEDVVTTKSTMDFTASMFMEPMQMGMVINSVTNGIKDPTMQTIVAPVDETNFAMYMNDGKKWTAVSMPAEALQPDVSSLGIDVQQLNDAFIKANMDSFEIVGDTVINGLQGTILEGTISGESLKAVFDSLDLATLMGIDAEVFATETSNALVDGDAEGEGDADAADADATAADADADAAAADADADAAAADADADAAAADADADATAADADADAEAAVALSPLDKLFASDIKVTIWVYDWNLFPVKYTIDFTDMMNTFVKELAVAEVVAAKGSEAAQKKAADSVAVNEFRLEMAFSNINNATAVVVPEAAQQAYTDMLAAVAAAEAAAAEAEAAPAAAEEAAPEAAAEASEEAAPETTDAEDTEDPAEEATDETLDAGEPDADGADPEEAAA